jgi:hypothetical protein
MAAVYFLVYTLGRRKHCFGRRKHCFGRRKHGVSTGRIKKTALVGAVVKFLILMSVTGMRIYFRCYWRGWQSLAFEFVGRIGASIFYF